MTTVRTGDEVNYEYTKISCDDLSGVDASEEFVFTNTRGRNGRSTGKKYWVDLGKFCMLRMEKGSRAGNDQWSTQKTPKYLLASVYSERK